MNEELEQLMLSEQVRPSNRWVEINPSADEIADACREIQATWTDSDRDSRRRGQMGHSMLVTGGLD